MARSVTSAACEVMPTTIRSGRSVSSTAKPSRRNSGFQASPAATPAGASSAIRAASRAAVPTGTVDLPITRQSRVRCGASPSTTASMWLRSAPAAPGSCGVPTQMKWASPNSAASSQGGAEAELPGTYRPDQDVFEPGLEEGRVTVLERGDLLDVGVHAEDLVADVGHAGGVHGTQITGPDDGNAHTGHSLTMHHKR